VKAAFGKAPPTAPRPVGPQNAAPSPQAEQEAQRQLQETQSQLATARHELARHSTALDAARKELAIHRMESATREAELQEKLRQAVKAGEHLTSRMGAALCQYLASPT